jgi:hypothetical protein
MDLAIVDVESLSTEDLFSYIETFVMVVTTVEGSSHISQQVLLEIETDRVWIAFYADCNPCRFQLACSLPILRTR